MKSLRPNNMHKLYYIKFWYAVGGREREEVLDILNGGPMQLDRME
jgi:hypothetical protein